MAQVAIHEAKKALRRELKKRIAGMSDDVKLKESASIVNKVSKATGSPSALFVGSGFRGHLVGIY